MTTETSTLTGTDKQIAWATDIRDAYLARIAAVDTTCAAALYEPETVAALDTLHALIAHLTDAGQVIDFRRDLDMLVGRIPAVAAMDTDEKRALNAARGVVGYGW